MHSATNSLPAGRWRGDRSRLAVRAAATDRTQQLEVRLARDQSDIAAFQALRYRVFYEEMSAVADRRTAAMGREWDDFDHVCDHLLVIDHGLDHGAVVGGYRLLRGAVAEARGGFYTAAEYHIDTLVAGPAEVLEMGRSCVHAAYRHGLVIQLLLRGIAAYVADHRIGLIFGCASLPGTDPEALALPLSYLAHNHLAAPELRPTALAERYVEMNRMAPEAVDHRAARAALPPLIKGYLRAGGSVGDGAVIDHQFGTVDVCMVIDTACVTDRFRLRYQT